MHIHLVGIAGSMTAPLAIALKKQGHYVTGSDQEKIYPPFSEQLKKAKIIINQTPINNEIDLAIIGSSYNSFKKTQDELEEIKHKNIPYISATEYISKNLIKDNSILVAGSYGKTTISAAIAFLLTKSGFSPSYMFGGQSLNHLDSLKFSNSNWSVVEADESINGMDIQAKFLYYPVKYLILTSAQWEHKESYPDEESNFNAFKNLIEKLPKDGALIYNSTDKSIIPLLNFANCTKVPYKATEFKNFLVGEHNQNNLGAVEVLAKLLEIDENLVKLSFLDFKGVKRRLELISLPNNIKFIDDFAQSPHRIKVAIKSINETFPDSNIKVFYESHASFMQYRSSLNKLKDAFSEVKETVIYKLKFNNKITAKDRLVAKDFLKNIPHSLYLPISSDVIKHYQDTLKSGDILIHFSSGGSDGLKAYKKIISLFKK